MKKLIFTAILIGVAAYPFQTYAHGGGCRKDSPPGKCCHMDRKKGEMHCH